MPEIDYSFLTFPKTAFSTIIGPQQNINIILCDLRRFSYWSTYRFRSFKPEDGGSLLVRDVRSTWLCNPKDQRLHGCN